MLTLEAEFFMSIAGIILSGGQGKRVGFREKGLIRYNGERLVDIKIRQLDEVCDKVYLVCKNCELYANLKGIQIVKDKYNVYWPVIGIYTALLTTEFENNFITAVDMPHFSKDLFWKLNKVNADIVVPKNDKIQVLYGFFKKSIVKTLGKWVENSLKFKKLPKIIGMFDLFNVQYINIEDNEFNFKNINYLKNKEGEI